MNDIIQVNSLYRHFKGDYYLVNRIAQMESNSEDIMVVYTSVTTGITFIRPYSEFFDLVTDREDNITHQTHRFELANELKNLLSLVNTAELVEELKTRGDNPFESCKPLNEDEDVWNVQFIVGRVVENKNDKGEVYTEFLPLTPSVFGTLEEARKYRDRFYSNRPAVIARRVVRKVEEFR